MDSTIIAASLNDKDLRDSIDKLVKHVDDGTRKMALEFDEAVKKMKASLKSLGDIKVDMGGVSDGGSSRRTKINKDEAKSVKETTVSYEQLAVAMQNATQPKSARDSFYAFAQGFKEQAQHIQMLIKNWESLLLNRKIGEFEAVGAAITQTTNKINALKQEITQLRRDQPTGYREQIKQRESDIERLKQKIIELRAEQQKIGNAPINDNDYLTRLRSELERVTNAMKDEAHAQQQVVTSAQQQTTAMQHEAQAKQESVAATQQQAQAEKQVEQILIGNAKITESVAEMQKRANRALVDNAQQNNFQTLTNYRQALASVLGLQEHEIKLANTRTDSYNKLNVTLKQLQAAYNQLNNSERESRNGQILVSSIQAVERAIQRIRSQASRPISLYSALGLPEKTLDDIAYKMRMLASYRNNLNIETQSNEIKRVNAEYEKLYKLQTEILGQNAKVAQSNAVIGRSLDYIKNRLAFVFTIGTTTQFVKQIYEIRGQYELLERSIGILVDSMQTGTHIFAELNAMAIKSPFTTMELGAAAKQLTAYDIAAKDVVDTTKRIADMAAAVGVPIERLTYALGQIKAYGYLNARDARMFANAGIPLVQNLADMYTKLEGRLVSVGDVYDRIKKKVISFEDVMKVVTEMTDEGGRFFNFQEKAADTLKVKLANLTLAYNNMLNEIGKSNQRLLTAPLVGLKTLYEHWRDINNVISSIAIAFGVAKAAQIIYIAYINKVSLATAAADVSSKRLVGTLYSVKGALLSLAQNPFIWLTAVISYFGYLGFQLWDLKEATRGLNKSISDNAQENIKSINKFFAEYQKDIDTIKGLSIVEQEKMWERVKEEIEKSSKNAKQYIELLENVPDVSNRITLASNYLSQIQKIQQEVQRLADHGYFSAGGGFADSGLADDLASYEKEMNNLIQKYGSLEKADEHFKGRTKSGGDLRITNSWGDYIHALNAAEKELNDFSSVLDNANISKIMGDGDAQTQLANIREFVSIVRESFLSTEKGQKITTEGRTLLNKELDKWISKQGLANGLISQEASLIEANRTAWEIFFSQITKKQKDALDYLIKTNQTGGEDFKAIWDKAAKSMEESALTSYKQIQEQIQQLRNTPDIVINLVYRETKEQLDEQQKEFEKRWITPKNWTTRRMSAEEYLKEETANRTKYGRLMRKEDEDNVEWEQRLGKEYKDNTEKIKSLNAMLKKSSDLSEADRKQKEKERDGYQDLNNVINEVGKTQNFNYEQFEKGKKGGDKKDYLGEALQKEVEIITNIQKRFKEYQKAGVDAQTSITKATQEYAKTLANANATLNRYGIKTTKSGSEFANMDLRDLRSYYETLLLMAQKAGNVKGIETLEKAIAGLNVEITKTDYKKITDGLNNELNKIKDEYELAVELDANPELGNMFTEMFGIDTSELPHTFGEAYKRAVNEAQNQLIKLKEYTNANFKIDDFDLISANFKPDENGQWNGIDVSSQIVQELVKAQKTWRDMYQKNLVETEKMLDDYVKKNGEYADRITEIERDKIEKMRKLNNAYFTEQMRQMPEYEAKRKAIEQGAANEKEQVNWDSFQNTRLYIMLFENLEYASSKCLTTMKDKLDNIRGSWKNLKPEQLKQVTTQYAKLESELIKRNPFKQLTKHINDYVKATGKSGKQAQKDFQEAQKNYDLQKSYVAELKVSYEQKKSQADVDKNMLEFLAQQITLEDEKLSRLKIELERAENLVEQYNLMKKALGEQADSIGQLLQTIAQNLQSIATLRDTLQQTFQFEFSAEINGAIDGFARMGRGISNVVNSAKSGDIFGTVNGVVDVFAGIGDGVASLFGDGSARTKRLNKEIEKSVETVRQLNMAYKSLEATVNNAMGAQELQARREQISNKQQQVEEIKRQMELEKRKRSKDRDNDAIKQYQETVQDLELEIAELKKDIVSNLLGGDIKDAAEQFVSAWVEAWRSGGDTMDALKGKFDDMIDSMVAKSIASYLVSKRLQRIFDAVDEATNDVSESGAEITINELNRLKSLIGDKSIAEQINQDLTNLYNALDIAYGADSENDKNLSALQQGIQSITEDTGGAIESYLNIVSQRMFEHGTILSEIRDAIGTFDFDVQLGIFSQMLLQLQQSYQVQQNIEAILSGVLNPSGRAIVVELN